MPTSPEDSALTVAAQSGDLDAFEMLVRRHTPAIYAHALRFFGDTTAAEDIVQEVWMKVYRALPTFDGRARLTTWLYRVTHNTCVDEVRQGRRRPVPMEQVDPPAPSSRDLGDAVALSMSLERSMRDLAPEDREALSAVALFDLTYAEAADALGVPVGTVKSRVFRARRTLAITLGITAGGA